MPRIMFEGQFGPTTEKKYQRALSAARALRTSIQSHLPSLSRNAIGRNHATRDALEKVLDSALIR